MGLKKFAEIEAFVTNSLCKSLWIFCTKRTKYLIILGWYTNILYSPSIFLRFFFFYVVFPHEYQEPIRNTVLICCTINAIFCHTLPKAFFDCYLNQILSTSSGHLDHVFAYLLIYIAVLHRALICDHTAKQLLTACPYHYRLSFFFGFHFTSF